MSSTQAWGVGIATVAADGTTLDTYFRHLGLGAGVPAGTPAESQTHTDPRRGVSLVPTSLVIDTTAAPTSASDVYLRLHLLSHRHVKPRTVNWTAHLVCSPTLPGHPSVLLHSMRLKTCATTN